MELASDIFVLLGALLVICALAWIWLPLGLLALGSALLAMGFVCALKVQRGKSGKDKS